MNNFEIRAASLSDMEAVASIEKKYMSEPWSQADYESTFGRDTTIFAVATDSMNQVVGFGLLCTAADEAELPDIVVDEGCRGQGLGNSLLSYLFEEAVKRNVHQVYLEVRQSNISAQKLYEKNGFEYTGIRKNFYKDPVEDGLCMHVSI